MNEREINFDKIKKESKNMRFFGLNNYQAFFRLKEISPADLIHLKKSDNVETFRPCQRDIFVRLFTV